jgi:hypothetical protein
MGVRLTNLTTYIHFKLQDIFVAEEAARLDAMNVNVFNMQDMMNIFDIAGANTLAVLENIMIVNNNAFTAATPPPRWTGVNVRGGAMAQVTDVVVEASTNVRYVFAAAGGSMISIANFDATDLVGGRAVVSKETE